VPKVLKLKNYYFPEKVNCRKGEDEHRIEQRGVSP